MKRDIALAKEIATMDSLDCYILRGSVNGINCSISFLYTKD